MNKIKHISIFISVLLNGFIVCGQQPVSELKAPIWVSSRPNSGFKFVGIGFADKTRGGNYQLEAKKNALYDLASEIKVDISSNSVLYTVQNNNNFNQNFNSLIKLSNTDNIEGYTLVDSYENDKQYWVYYQLDKQEYANQKARKKQQVLSKASNLIAASFTDEKNMDFSSSLKKRVQAFGVLTPYLGEEISFDPTQSGGVANVFDLTNLIQKQLQNIRVSQMKEIPVLKPYQASYNPLLYKLELQDNKAPLQNFPFELKSEDERVLINEKTTTNMGGEVQVKINSVEPANQYVTFALSPDISNLMGTDSVGRAGITLLKQFIQTSSLKVQALVSNITVRINSVEKNLGKVLDGHIIGGFIAERFSGSEISLTEDDRNADYIIEAVADTKEDISSDLLQSGFNIRLAVLNITFQLKDRSGRILYKTVVSDLYGYANSLEKAGYNAYQSPRLRAKLMEAVFFLKRKVLVY